MSKTLTHEQKRRSYVREQLKLHPPFGSELVLYGSIIILMWALGELNASYTFIRAWFKVDQKILETYNISFKSYFHDIILTTPEAREALTQLAILCLGIVMGLIGIVLRKRKISILMIVTALIIATYEVPSPFWLRVTSYTRYVKMAGCLFMFTGGVCKIATWAVKRRLAGEKYDLTHKKKKQSELAQRDKTLIPARQMQNRR